MCACLFIYLYDICLRGSNLALCFAMSWVGTSYFALDPEKERYLSCLDSRRQMPGRAVGGKMSWYIVNICKQA